MIIDYFCFNYFFNSKEYFFIFINLFLIKRRFKIFKKKILIYLNMLKKRPTFIICFIHVYQTHIYTHLCIVITRN
jgi:hypothetical protein